MTSKELLGIPDAPPGLLLLGQNRREERSRPSIGPTPESSVLSRLKAFLPEMAQANERLEGEMKGRPREAFDIEANAGEDDAPHIEMDLALGVAELKTPEALAAAERAVNGQTVRTSSPHAEESSSEDEEQDDTSTAIEKKGELLQTTAGEVRLTSAGARQGSKKRARIQEVG